MKTWELWKILEEGGSLRNTRNGRIVIIEPIPASKGFLGSRKVTEIYADGFRHLLDSKSLFKSPEAYEDNCTSASAYCTQIKNPEPAAADVPCSAATDRSTDVSGQGSPKQGE